MLYLAFWRTTDNIPWIIMLIINLPYFLSHSRLNETAENLKYYYLEFPVSSLLHLSHTVLTAVIIEMLKRVLACENVCGQAC